GRGAAAAREYLAAAESAAPAEALDLRRWAAGQLLRSGHVDEGLGVLRTTLAAVGLRLPDTPAAASRSLLFRRVLLWGRGLRFRERDEGQLRDADLVRLDTCWSAAIGLNFVEKVRAWDFQARYLLLALQAGEPSRL